MDIIAIVGPTATGKSDLAVRVAHELGGAECAEIINADAYQLYRGMDIGTAKATVAEQNGIRHHLLDVLDPMEDSSVAKFQEVSRLAIDDILDRGKRPIVVGGSGLYVRAMLDEMNFPGTDPDLRAALEERERLSGTRSLFDELLMKDPEAAASIDVRNGRRIIRALEVIELTGLPYSANLPRQEYVRPAFTLGLDFDRAALDERVAVRVRRMMTGGLIDEVARLSAQGLGRTAERAVGYAEILAYFNGELTVEEAEELIVTNTRRLTRKQMGWFGRDPRIVWCNGQSETLVADAVDAIARHDQGLIDPLSDEPVRRSLGS